MGSAHVMDAVRLLVSWLWNGSGSWPDVTVQDIDAAYSAVQAKTERELDFAFAVMEGRDALLKKEARAPPSKRRKKDGVLAKF